MASVVKRCDHENRNRCGCNWVVRYRDAAGRQREESFLHSQKQIAQDRKLKIEYDLRAGEPVFSRRADSNETLGEFVATWIEQHPASPKTKANYRSALAQHINPAVGTVRLDRIGRSQIRELLLETMPKVVGHSTIAMARAVLVGSLNEAVRQKKLSENVASGIRLPSAGSERAEFRFATYAELETLESELPRNWQGALWLMRGSGLRIGEALAIRSDNVRGDVLRVEAQILQSRTLGPLKHRKPGEYRDVPLPRYVAERLVGNGYLFPEFASGTVLTRAWREAFRRGASAAGLPASFTPHDLRHTYASIALSNGVPITDVSRWLGHRDINLTHRVYGHLVPGASGRAAEVIDREFSEWSNVRPLRSVAARAHSLI